MKKRTSTIASITTISVLGSTIGYSGWLISANFNGAKPEELKSDAICFIQGTERKFVDIGAALRAAEKLASSKKEITVIVYPNKQTITINKTIEVPDYVHLQIPFIEENGNYVWETPTDSVPNYGKTRGDANENAVKNFRSSQLLFTDGADLTINKNAYVELGGATFTQGNYGRYSEITLSKGSHIDCYGTLYDYGYIKEHTDTVSYFDDEPSNYENANDKERYVKVYGGGNIYSYFCIDDALTGGALGQLITEGQVCPFNSYDFSGIQTYMSIEYSAHFYASAVLNVGGKVGGGDALIVGTGNEENALFRLKENNSWFSIEYCPKTNGITDGSKGGSYTNIWFNGAVDLNKININVSSYPLDSTKFFVPFNYKENIYIGSTGDVSNSKKYKILPGSHFEIMPGGKLTNSGSIIVYDTTNLPNGWNYKEQSKSGELIVNGQLDNTGNIGSFIQHKSTNKSGNLSFENMGNKSSFTVESPEGMSKTMKSVKSYGYFMDNNEKTQSSFERGSKYTSNNQGDYYYWEGKHAVTHLISVNVRSTNYKYQISEYSLYYSDKADGSKPVEIIKGADTANNYSIPFDKYLVVKARRVNDAIITTGGQTISFTNGQAIFKPTGDVSIEIIPSEAVKVSIVTDQLKEDKWGEKSMSGSGSIVYYASEKYNNADFE